MSKEKEELEEFIESLSMILGDWDVKMSINIDRTVTVEHGKEKESLVLLLQSP